MIVSRVMGRRIATAFAFLITAALPSMASAQFALRGSVVANGATAAAGGNRKLLGTVGQAAVGISSGTNRMVCHGFWCFGGSRVVSVDDLPPAQTFPEHLAFGRGFPNPSREGVRFAVDLPQAGFVDLRVIDVQGRLVRVIENQRLEPGFLTLVWDGSDESGSRVGAGVYFARLVVQGHLVGQRRIVIRD